MTTSPGGTFSSAYFAVARASCPDALAMTILITFLDGSGGAVD